MCYVCLVVYGCVENAYWIESPKLFNVLNICGIDNKLDNKERERERRV